MNTLRVVYHLARADFLERIRRYSFLVVLAATLFTCYEVHTGNIGLSVSGFRGTMNSAWLGATMTLMATTLLGFVGFYIVNNSIALDESSRVGQLLAATPLSKAQYIFGKALSNFCVLSVIILVLMLASVPLQWLAGEDRHIRVIALAGPFIFISLPMMALISAIAVFFETVKWLRGALGNVAYFFLITTMLSMGFVGKIEDPTALKSFETSMQATAKHQIANYDKDNFSFGIGRDVASRGFTWNGLDPDRRLIEGRLLWLAIALGICGLATLSFNRFESDRLRNVLVKAAGAANHRLGGNGVAEQVALDAGAINIDGRQHSPGFAPLPPVRTGLSGPGLFLAELEILLKGRAWWWYAGVAGGIIAAFTMPAAEFRQSLWFAWIWPIAIWSHTGNRESQFGTEEIVFSAPRPLWRQLPVTWLAGFSVAMLAASGVLLRLAASGDWVGVEKVAAGAVFLASLALGLGAASGSSKLFEAVYTVLWYIGPLNRMAALDYTQIAGSGNRSATWLAISGLLVLLAIVSRAMRLRR
jgi:hypothetical protein